MDSLAPSLLGSTCVSDVATPEDTAKGRLMEQAVLDPPTTPRLTLHEYRRQQHSPTPSFWSDFDNRRIRRKPSLANLSPRCPSDPVAWYGQGTSSDGGQVPRDSSSLVATHEMWTSNDGGRVSKLSSDLIAHGPSIPSDGAQVLHLQDPFTRLSPSHAYYDFAHAPSLTSTIDSLPSTATSRSTERESPPFPPFWASEASAQPIRTKRKFEPVTFAKRLPSRASEECHNENQRPWQVHAAIVDLNEQGEGATSHLTPAFTSWSIASERHLDPLRPKAVHFALSDVQRIQTPSSIPLGQGEFANTDSSFTLSKYQFPVPPTASRSTPLGSSIEQTPPTTPATLHLKEASFELVNPHDSLLLGLHEFETPAEIDGLLDDYFHASSSDHTMASSSSLASDDTKRGRQLFQDLASAHRNITGVGTQPTIEQDPETSQDLTDDSENAAVRVEDDDAGLASHFRPVSSVYPGSLRSNPFDLELSDDRNGQPNIDGVVAVGERDGVVANAPNPPEDDDATYGSIIADYEYTRDPFGDAEGRAAGYAPPHSLSAARTPQVQIVVPPQDCRRIGLVVNTPDDEAQASQTYGSTGRLLNITPQRMGSVGSPSPPDTIIVAEVSPEATWRASGLSHVDDHVSANDDSIADTSVYSQEFVLPESSRLGDRGADEGRRTLGMLPLRNHDEPFERAVSVMERGLQNAHLSRDEFSPDAPTLDEMRFLEELQKSNPGAHARALQHICRGDESKRQSLNSFDHVVRKANAAGESRENVNSTPEARAHVDERARAEDATHEAGWPSRIKSMWSFSKTPKTARPSVYTPYKSFERARGLYEGERSASQATESRGLLGLSPSPYGNHNTLEFSDSRGTFQTLPHERPQTPLNFVSPPVAAYTSLGRVRNLQNIGFTHGEFEDIPLTPVLPEPSGLSPNMHEGPVQPIIEGAYFPRPTLRLDRPSRVAVTSQTRALELELGDVSGRSSRRNGPTSDPEFVRGEARWAMSPEFGSEGALHQAHLRGINVYPTRAERALMQASREQANPEYLEWRRVSNQYLMICCLCPITALLYGTGHMDKFMEKKTGGRFVRMHNDSKRLALIFGVPMSLLFYAVIGIVLAFSITVAIKGGTDWD